MAGLLTACNGDKQKAAGLLERANASFEAGDYNLAKLQIDSIRTFYPKAFDARKEGIRLMQRVDLEEQQKSLVYLDSMMAVKQAALDSKRIPLTRKSAIISIRLRWWRRISDVRSCGLRSMNWEKCR